MENTINETVGTAPAGVEREPSAFGRMLLEFGEKVEQLGAAETNVTHGRMWKWIGAEAVVALGITGLYAGYLAGGPELSNRLKHDIFDPLWQEGWFDVSKGDQWKPSVKELAENFLTGQVSGINPETQIREVIDLSPEARRGIYDGLQALSQRLNGDVLKVAMLEVAANLPFLKEVILGNAANKAEEKVKFSTILQFVGKALQGVAKSPRANI